MKKYSRSGSKMRIRTDPDPNTAFLQRKKTILFLVLEISTKPGYGLRSPRRLSTSSSSSSPATYSSSSSASSLSLLRQQNGRVVDFADLLGPDSDGDENDPAEFDRPTKGKKTNLTTKKWALFFYLEPTVSKVTQDIHKN